MNGSFRIGSVLGITVRIHFTLLLLVGFLVLQGTARGIDGLSIALDTGILFMVVLLHELGHSVVAQYFGIRVVDITLWPLGGMARMNAIPESTRMEACIAVAGPLVNFALAAIALPIWMSFGSDRAFGFLVMNVVMGVFNLIPAFPMDGGRILRAILGLRGDWVAATRLAVRIGRVIAVGLGGLAVLSMIAFGQTSGLWIFPVLAFFLWTMGEQELVSVMQRHGLQGARAGARRTMFRASMWTYRGPDLRAEPIRREPVPQAAAVDRDAARDADRAGERGGFTDEEIGRLEEFRGPLSQYLRRDQ